MDDHDDTMDTPKNPNKHELRQKLESMKKAYAQTLHKVQKSEKANRARSYVQHKLAEQRQHDASDSSPSCTYRLKNMTPGEGCCHMQGNVSPLAVIGELSKVHIDEKPATDIGDGNQGARSTMTTRRMQRKRRSVSFSIPNEDTPEKSCTAVTLTADTDWLGPSEFDCKQQAKTKEVSLKMSPKSTGFRATSGPSDLVVKGIMSQNDVCSVSEVTDQSVLIVPESQFMDTIDFKPEKQVCEHLKATASYDIPDCVYVKKCGNLCDGGKQNLESGSFTKDNSEDFSERPADLLRTSCQHIQTEDNSSTSSGQQHTTKMQTKRVGRKSRRRSKHTRGLTVSDISMKEIVESQGTEEGSHTWIEGLMFPAEYYVRRTRSMTSNEGQNQNSEGLTEDVGTKLVQKGSLTESSKGSPRRRVDLLDSDKISTDSCESFVQSDSDTSKSQLSESILKTVPVPRPMQEYTDKDFAEIGLGKSTRIVKSKRQKQGSSNKFSLENTETLSSSGSATSILKTQNGDTQSHTPSLQLHKSVSNSQRNVLNESKSKCAVRQFHLAAGKVKVLDAEFTLPEDEFGALKLAKSQSTLEGSSPASNVSTARTGSLDNDIDNFVQKPNLKLNNQHGIANTEKKSLPPVEITSKSKDEMVTKSRSEVSQTKHILHSQLSPTQYLTVCNCAHPVPDCTPGWSPTSTPHVSSGPKARPLLSPKMSEQTHSPRNKDENKDNLSNEDHRSSNEQITCSVPRRSQTNLDLRFLNNSESPRLLCAIQQSAPSQQNSKLSKSVPTPERTCYTHANRNMFPETRKDGVSTDGNTTPPINIPFNVGPVCTKSNINQVSPFAGVATASPHGRAEEPMAMSQCEVKVPNDAENETDGVRNCCSEQLVLMGCLQHDVPWEANSTVRDVTGGKINVGDSSVSLLAVIYQHTLVMWWNSPDTTEWEILQSWALPQEEEFLCVRFLPCNADSTVSLVVAGRFASCSVKLLRYDTVTKDTQQLDVNLGHLNAVPAPHLLCPTHKQSFAVGIRVEENTSDVYLVQAWADHSDVKTLKLSTGMDTTLMSLLLVDGVEDIMVATTLDNHILLWNYESGELLKDVPMELLNTCRHTSCLKATAESGLLFLVMIFHDDRTSLNARFRGCVGATVVLNPHTDKTMTLVEYRTSEEHMDLNLVEAILHGNSLLVQLSDGSLHQWDIFTGNLMNYSSGQPTSHTLRSASLCKSEVAILGTDQCQQVYGNVKVTY